MNSQNSEETKTPMIPPGFEMKNDVENEEKRGKNETSKKSEKEEKNVDESNQVMQNPVTTATVENKDESKTLESAVGSLEQQSKKSSEEFEDYEKVELLDCNVGTGDQEAQNVLSEEKDVENESVRAATTETKNSETGQQYAEPTESINAHMDENDGDKPKIVTLEEMFDEIESEKFQSDVNEANNYGAVQQNLKSMTAYAKVYNSEASHKSDKQRESDAVNVQKSEIHNADPHAITVASDVEHFKNTSKTKSVDKEQSNNEGDKIQQEEKSIMKNESNEIKEFLDTVLMIVSTESGDEEKSKVPEEEVVEEETIPKNAKFEMGQKAQFETATVDSKVHNKSQSDKTEVFADKVDVEKKKESIQPKIVQEGKDQSLKSDIGVDTKDVNSGTDNVQINKTDNELKSEKSRGSIVSTPKEEGDSESKNVSLEGLQQEKKETLNVSDISLKADGENTKDGKVAALASDESQTIEQHQIQPAKGLVKSFSKTLVNLFSCGNDVTSFNKDVDSESIRDQNVQHGNNESTQFYIPNVGKDAAVEEDKKDETIAVDKIQVVPKNEVIQNQPIQSFNPFSSVNIDAEIERSRLQNDAIAQDEQKGHSYSPGFEAEKVIENQCVQPNEAIQQQKEVGEMENKVLVGNRVKREHAEVKEISTEKSSTPMQASETLKDETDKPQQRQQLWNDNNDSWSDVDDVVNAGDSASKIVANGNVPSTELPVSTAEPDAAENNQPNNSFNLIFDEYFLKFLEIESSKFEVSAIQSFAETIPSDFIVTENQYPILFKVLFKIKEISNKTIFDQSLTVLKKLFWNLDYNKFLVQFWGCDEFKNRENGPIGFSFTEGLASMVLTGNLPKHERDVAKVNEKAVEAAWSILLDVEATVTKMLENVFTNKAMNPFYTAVFRKLRCLGEFMIVINGKNLPIFFHFYYQVFASSEGNKLIIGLTLLVNVCKSPKSENASALMKPNFVLQEIMSHLICDDEKKEAYI
uniref:Uncharacterized protein n=1 Tax=Panagrolaimus davidi TaxID=227884 RepID=A0A914PT14_9BILA